MFLYGAIKTQSTPEQEQAAQSSGTYSPAMNSLESLSRPVRAIQQQVSGVL
jgi:hypothetical protein